MQNSETILNFKNLYMKRLVVSIVFILVVIQCFSQVSELNVPVQNYVKKEGWKANWISNPDIYPNEYSVSMYRKIIDLDSQPEKYIIHVSGDNRYQLYINGKYVCFGPQLSDPRHWRYETIDIASFLQKGKNIIAAEVINWGQDRFFGIISTQSALIIDGNSENEEAIRTNDKTWKTAVNKAYRIKHVNWMFSKDIVGGFYASNPTDSVDANQYPWGWNTLEYNDSDWKNAKWIAGASAFGGSMNWILKPRTTPLLVSKMERFNSIARSENIKVDQEFLQGKKELKIPANSKVSFLIDHKYLSIGFPEIIFSGGKNSHVRIGYAENLFDKNREKGNRNDIKDKHFIGIRDVYDLDGSVNAKFKPLWMRSFRFVFIEIETKNDPLTLNDFYNVYVSAPFDQKGTFLSGNPRYDKLMEVCARTVKNCTQDNYVSDAYYEQMMYVGDSRPHAMTYLSLTGDTLHFRNAIEQFSYSRLPDGMITSCYPLKATFVHPTFSLIWIDMLFDYFMFCTDKKFVKDQLPAARLVFDYFERISNENGIPGETEWAYFVDWYEQGRGGTAPESQKGNSATISLHYVYTLQNAAKMFSYFGMKYEADLYLQRAEALKKKVLDIFYDKSSGIVMEYPNKTFFDQHANIMAVLTDLVPIEEQKKIMETILNDNNFSRAGFYYRFNMFNALKHSKTGFLFEKVCQPWYDLIDLGLTTTPEAPLHIRSESHPWASSPAYGFFSVICGISPAEPGFKKIIIEPDLGDLQYINASYPHFYGLVKIDLKKTGKDKISGKITLPQKLSGDFIWKGKTINLLAGENTINN